MKGICPERWMKTALQVVWGGVHRGVKAERIHPEAWIKVALPSLGWGAIRGEGKGNMP